MRADPIQSKVAPECLINPPESPSDQFWGKMKLNIPREYKTQVGNRKMLIRGVDERDWRYRRGRELYFGILQDLGGPDNVSTLQDKLAKDLAMLLVMGEELVESWINGREDWASLLYLTYIKTAMQISKSLGIKRVQKKIVQMNHIKDPESLDEFLKQEGITPAIKRKPGRPKKPRLEEGEAIEIIDPNDPDDNPTDDDDA